MNPQTEWNNRWKFFYHFTGLGMNIYNTFKHGMEVPIYSGLLEHLVTKEGFPVERNKSLPIYWGDDLTTATCTIDFLIKGKIIVETYSQEEITQTERQHLKNLLTLTHCPYGMVMNYSRLNFYSEWYYRDPQSGIIDKIKLL